MREKKNTLVARGETPVYTSYSSATGYSKPLPTAPEELDDDEVEGTGVLTRIGEALDELDMQSKFDEEGIFVGSGDVLDIPYSELSWVDVARCAPDAFELEALYEEGYELVRGVLPNLGSDDDTMTMREVIAVTNKCVKMLIEGYSEAELRAIVTDWIVAQTIGLL